VPTIYIIDQGVRVTKQSRRIVICGNNKTLLEIPEFQVDRILIFGNIHITTPALCFFLDRGIDVAFLTLRGKYRGRLTSRFSKNIFLRIKMFELYRDEKYCLEFAKNIVKGKLLTINEKVKDKVFIEELKERLKRKNSLNSVRGIEGIATAVYFGELAKKIPEEYRFKNRKMHPSPDIVNASLSLCYTLLTNEFISLIESHGLDPHIGIFHQINYGRPSLALDLIEEFRVPVVDELLKKLLNLRIFREKIENYKEEGYRLSEEEVKVLIANYEERVMKWRDIFKKQIEKLAKNVKNGEVYEPYVLCS